MGSWPAPQFCQVRSECKLDVWSGNHCAPLCSEPIAALCMNKPPLNLASFAQTPLFSSALLSTVNGVGTEQLRFCVLCCQESTVLETRNLFVLALLSRN